MNQTRAKLIASGMLKATSVRPTHSVDPRAAAARRHEALTNTPTARALHILEATMRRQGHRSARGALQRRR